MLRREARTVIASDLAARQFVEPAPEQYAQLDAIPGVEWTSITETVSMAGSSVPDAPPVLISIKAVDPAQYPYYGQVKLNPDIPLAQALGPDTVAVGEDLLIRLG